MSATIEKDAKWEQAYTIKRPEDYDAFISWAAMNHAGALTAVCELADFQAETPLKILELGTGTGLLTQKILERFPNAEVLGIDGAAPMLAVAEIRLAPFKARFKSTCSSFENYPWAHVKEGTYDLIVSSFALHHMDHGAYPIFFAGLRRILKPGGRIVVADFIRSVSDRVQHQHEGIWVETRRRQMKEALGVEQTREQVWLDHNRTKQEEGDNPAPLSDLLGWLSESGFEDVDCHWKHFCLAVYGGVKV